MINFNSIYRPISFAGGRETLLFGTIADRMSIGRWGRPDSEPINLDPDYQRGHVWTVEQQQAFVGHMLEGGATPMVILNRDSSCVDVDEVVDGKQRITAVAAWIKGEIAAELTDGIHVYLSDFSDDDQRKIMGLGGPNMDCSYVMLARPDVLRLYLRLNRGGTVHTKEEINRVRALLTEDDSKNMDNPVFAMPPSHFADVFLTCGYEGSPLLKRPDSDE